MARTLLRRFGACAAIAVLGTVTACGETSDPSPETQQEQPEPADQPEPAVEPTAPAASADGPEPGLGAQPDAPVDNGGQQPPDPPPASSPGQQQPPISAVPLPNVDPAENPDAVIGDTSGGSPGGEVSGGGPGEVSGGGPRGENPVAKARMDAQLPPGPNDIVLDGEQALTYAERIAAAIPGASSSFGLLAPAASCAINHGVVGARAYITRDYAAAGVMVVVSRGQSHQLPQIGLSCLIDEVLSSGPGGMCLRQYYYDATTDGVADRYYVMLAGTNEATCANLSIYHSAYAPVSVTGA